MDFEADIRQHILSELPHRPNEAAELSALPLSRLLVVYKNWQSRLIPARPRRVHRSQALVANPQYTAPEVGLLIDKLEGGADVTPHLSRDIQEGYRSNVRHRPDLDLMLNDWGVHHMHLSSEICADGFVRPGGPLLFAAFKPDDVYLIDIMGHGDWTRYHVLGVMVREWPEAQLLLKLSGAQGSGRQISEAERKALRNKRTNAFFEIDGSLYAPRTMGLSSAGTSSLTTLHVIHMLRAAEHFQTELAKDSAPLAAALASANLPVPEQPDLHFAFLDNGAYGVVESQTRAFMQLGAW